ncbi:hypothetical protein FF1_021648 [Malus domestica]
MAEYSQTFQGKGVKLVGLSCDDVPSHLEWIKDIEATAPSARWITRFWQIRTERSSSKKQLNMVNPDVKDSSGNQVPSHALNIVKLSFLYLASTGWNLDEVVRVLESLQKANKHKDEAKKMFPQGYKTMDLPSKEYLRFTDV